MLVSVARGLTKDRYFMTEQPISTKWTRAQRKYIEWVATPEELREHRKLWQYAEAAGVHRTTLWTWRRIPGFNDEVQKYTKQYLGDTLPEALQALKNLAAQGSFPHLKLYLEMLGMYVPKQQIDHNHYVQVMREEATRIALQRGLDPDEVIAEAERLLGAKY